jgi:ATP-binding cassette subfamily F protein uup
LFDGEDLNQRVGRLSGGERARVLIAQLMLQPADVLLLDEPTNDLDIPTLEILEESLLEYAGALVLVTHDRYMLDRVSTVVLGLDGLGGAERFADYSQWDAWQQRSTKANVAEQKSRRNAPASSASVSAPSGTRRTPANGEGAGARGGTRTVTEPVLAAAAPKKLSYNEARELSTMEKRIAEAEANLDARRAALEDPAIVADADALRVACTEMAQAQKAVDELYARWAELERKGDG